MSDKERYVIWLPRDPEIEKNKKARLDYLMKQEKQEAIALWIFIVAAIVFIGWFFIYVLNVFNI